MGKSKNNKKNNVNNANNKNNKKNNGKWYTNSIVIILLLATLWPLGLFLMWTVKDDWSKSTKVIVTVIILGFTFLSCGGNADAAQAAVNTFSAFI